MRKFQKKKRQKTKTKVEIGKYNSCRVVECTNDSHSNFLQIIEKSNCPFVSAKRAESNEGIKGGFSCSVFDIAPGRCLPEPKNVIGSHHMSEKTKHKSAVSFLSTNSNFFFFLPDHIVYLCAKYSRNLFNL